MEPLSITIDTRMQFQVRAQVTTELRRKFPSLNILGDEERVQGPRLDAAPIEAIAAASAAVSAAVAVIEVLLEFRSRQAPKTSIESLMRAVHEQLKLRQITHGTIVKIEQLELNEMTKRTPCVVTCRAPDGREVLVFVHRDGASSSYVLGLRDPLGAPGGSIR